MRRSSTLNLEQKLIILARKSFARRASDCYKLAVRGYNFGVLELTPVFCAGCFLRPSSLIAHHQSLLKALFLHVLLRIWRLVRAFLRKEHSDWPKLRIFFPLRTRFQKTLKPTETSDDGVHSRHSADHRLQLLETRCVRHLHHCTLDLEAL